MGCSEAAVRARGVDVVVVTADPAESARGYIHDFHVIHPFPAFNRVLGQTLEELAAEVGRL